MQYPDQMRRRDAPMSVQGFRASPKRALFDALLEPARLRRIAIAWIAAAACALALHLWSQTAAGLTDGDGHPFGDDFLNFWSAPRLALLGRIGDVYDFARFHQF